uniref:TadE/TadG family type IV pilus assembly protein n=1 Tax=uncultured Altererythrobacter sp. TaxID=500840 RepID=UPI00262A0899|nr:TadE/TadG family type IV pilus assembly protein [uncultured Altererythrobacter sp.]
MPFRRFINNTRGAAAAEMALILPLSILLLFTGLEAGHYFYQQHQVVKALRDGARYAARQSFDDMTCGTPNGTVVTNVQNLTVYGTLGTGSPRINTWAPADVTVTVDCSVTGTFAQTGIYDATDTARKVVLTTTVNYNSLFNGLGVITDSYSLNARQEAAVMGI